MANYVGVDLSNHQLRVLEAEGSARKLKLKRFRRVELIPTGEAQTSAFQDKELAKPIDEAFSKAKISREPTALSWDSDLTVFRELELPFTSNDQIRKVVKYEAEAHLHNCDIDDVVVSYYKLGEEKDKSHLMVMAVRKDQLLNRLDILSRAGVDPLMADLDVMAAFNALSALGVTKERKNFMVLDVGRRTTNLMLVANERLVAGRAIRMGSDTLMRRIADDLETEVQNVKDEAGRLLADPRDEVRDDLLVPVRTAGGEETEETKKLPVELARDLALQRAGEFYGKLAREVNRTLATARIPEPVELVYVTGAGSALPGFAEQVASRLGIDAPLEPLALLQRVEAEMPSEDMREVELEGLTALGLCFKLAGHDVTGVDFRQEEARYARKFDQIKEPLLYLSGLLLFFVLLLNFIDLRLLSYRKPFLVQPDHSNIGLTHDLAHQAYKRALGKDAKLPENVAKPSLRSINYMLNRVRERVELLKGELGRGGSIPELPSAFKLWKDCFDAIQTRMGTIDKLYLDNMTIAVRNQSQPSIELNGYVPTAGAYSDLIEALGTIEGKESVIPGAAGPKTVDGVELYSFSKLRVEYPRRTDT
jgi:type IV pilus assembly protein PilM